MRSLASVLTGLSSVTLVALTLIGIFPWSDSRFQTTSLSIAGSAGWTERICAADNCTTHRWSGKDGLQVNPLVWRSLFIVPVCLSAVLVGYIMFGHYCYAVKWHEAKSSKTLLGVACLFCLVQALLCGFVLT